MQSNGLCRTSFETEKKMEWQCEKMMTKRQNAVMKEKLGILEREDRIQEREERTKGKTNKEL